MNSLTATCNIQSTCHKQDIQFLKMNNNNCNNNLTMTVSDGHCRCSAANKAAANKIVKYGALSASHIFCQWQLKPPAPGTSPP